MPIYNSHYYGELIDGEGVEPSQALIFVRKGAFHISLGILGSKRRFRKPKERLSHHEPEAILIDAIPSTDVAGIS